MSDLIEAIDDVTVLVDGTGRIEQVNRAWQAFAHANAAAPLTAAGVGVNYLDVCRAAGAAGAEIEGALADLLAGRTARVEHEYPCHSPDQARWFRLVATARPGATGAVILHRDITDHWLAERRRRIWRAVLDSAVSHSAELEAQLMEHICRGMGFDAAIHWSPTRGIARTCHGTWQLRRSAAADDRRAEFDEVTRGLHLAYRVPIETETEGYAVLEFFAATRWPKDPALLDTLVAVGAYAAQLASRRAAETRFTALFESAPDAMVVVDARGTITLVNRAAEAASGYPRSELVGASIATLIPEELRAVHAAHHAHYLLDPSERRMGSRQLHVRRKDGTLFPAEISLSPLGTTPNSSVVAAIRDVTARLAADERTARSRHLEALGQLAGGVAHEINTPMQYLGDNVRFLGEAVVELRAVAVDHVELLAAAALGPVPAELVDTLSARLADADLEFLLERSPKALAACRDGVERVAAIVAAMKRLTHGGDEDMGVVDLNAAVAASLLVTRNEWKFVADVVTALDPTLPMIAGRAGHLNQVLLNLIVNAAHALEEVAASRPAGKGTITVSSRRVDDDVELRIGDDGPGMTPEIRLRIFEPFFTTKEVGKGTGQGLAIAHAVVVGEHGGRLEVDTEVGRGTTFVIRLPIARAAAGGARVAR